MRQSLPLSLSVLLPKPLEPCCYITIRHSLKSTHHFWLLQSPSPFIHPGLKATVCMAALHSTYKPYTATTWQLHAGAVSPPGTSHSQCAATTVPPVSVFHLRMPSHIQCLCHAMYTCSHHRTPINQPGMRSQLQPPRVPCTMLS